MCSLLLYLGLSWVLSFWCMCRTSGMTIVWFISISCESCQQNMRSWTEVSQTYQPGERKSTWLLGTHTSNRQIKRKWSWDINAWQKSWDRLKTREHTDNWWIVVRWSTPGGSCTRPTPVPRKSSGIYVAHVVHAIRRLSLKRNHNGWKLMTTDRYKCCIAIYNKSRAALIANKRIITNGNYWQVSDRTAGTASSNKRYRQVRDITVCIANYNKSRAVLIAKTESRRTEITDKWGIEPQVQLLVAATRGTYIPRKR